MTAIKREERIGDCRLILGDCLEVMPTLGKVDAVVTDPPYGIGSNNKNTNKNNYNSFQDDPSVVVPLVTQVLEIARADRFVMTPGQKLMFEYPTPTAVGVYYYPAGVGACSWGFVTWQPIFYYGKDPALSDSLGSLPNSLISSEPAEKNGHPCPKPIKQWTWLVKRTTRSCETVLDPFMGSGTTLVACAKLGRKGIGIEIDPDYFDIACRRVEEAYRQPDLFIAPPEKPVQESFEALERDA